jgi:hypothetical protein
VTTPCFVIEGAHEARSDLVLGAGVLGRHVPDARHKVDIQRALEIARRIGELDIGQGAVVCDGLVLAVEAQEGTDAMLRRVAEDVAPALRGEAGRRRGVLAKAPKPIQETRVEGRPRPGSPDWWARRAGHWSSIARRWWPWRTSWGSSSWGLSLHDPRIARHHAGGRRGFRG